MPALPPVRFPPFASSARRPPWTSRAWRDYVGGGVDLYGADNTEHSARVVERLRHHRESGTPITVWYDPEDPAATLIDRSFPWFAIVFPLGGVLAFGGVAGWLVYLSLTMKGFEGKRLLGLHKGNRSRRRLKRKGNIEFGE